METPVRENKGGILAHSSSSFYLHATRVPVETPPDFGPETPISSVCVALSGGDGTPSAPSFRS